MCLIGQNKISIFSNIITLPSNCIFYKEGKLARVYKSKAFPDYTGNICPRCSSKLVYRTNHLTKEKFVGCSNRNCKYTNSIRAGYLDRCDYVIQDYFPDGWKPEIIDEYKIYKLLAVCGSRDEIAHVFGIAYYLEKQRGGIKISLSPTYIIYNGKKLNAIWFKEPYEFLNGNAPSAMALVPQLEFANNCHHDFGIFISDNHSASENDWHFEMAVEVDYCPSHAFTTSDWGRDSMVNYFVLRLTPGNGKGWLTWFSKVNSYWTKKYDN